MIEEDNKTIWCGNLTEQVTEEILYELFLQAGPLEKVKIVRDKDGRQRSFAFITYCHEISVPYALNLFRGTSLFHRTLSLQCRGRMPLLPPPIRFYGPEPPMEVMSNNQVQLFANMTERLNEDMSMFNQNIHGMPQDMPPKINDQLVMASLQGNWTHRHHPYMPKDNKNHRSDYRARDSHHGSSRRPNNWRDNNRHYKKGNNYHRRD